MDPLGHHVNVLWLPRISIPTLILYRSSYPAQGNQFDIPPNYETHNILSLLQSENLNHTSTLTCSPAPVIYEQNRPADLQGKTNPNLLHLSKARVS